MKIEIKLIRSKKETAEGFPLVVELSHQGKRKQKTIAFCKDNHFSEEAKLVTSRHPDYDILIPILMDIKLRARKIILSGIVNVDKAHEELFKIDFSGISFAEYGEELTSEMKVLAAQFEKIKDTVARNKILGNIKVYENALSQFNSIVPGVLLADLDYNTLMRFRNYHVSLGNSKSTVNLYLRTIRTIYNKGVLKHRLPDNKPFKGVFDGLKVKSYDNKKKYVTKEVFQLIENFDFGNGKQKYIDLFKLQFYFGGADLIDIYYLKKLHYKKNRIYFERGKTTTGLLLDLGVHPKAKTIIEKYISADKDEWLFTWRKDKTGYEGFRRRYSRALEEMAEIWNEKESAKKELDPDYEKNPIEVMPLGGNLGVKVARHTFANLAKNLMIEPDLIRELMGHERDDVDNYYKDRFPEKMRDEALFRIIG